MKAFHNDQTIKTKYVDRVVEHQRLDRLRKGAMGENGRGCAVACTLDMVYDHSRYPIELGIPEWLARVEDTLFEGMNLEKSKTWPEVFLNAIPVGSDCEKAKTPFMIKILERNLRSLDRCEFDREKHPKALKAIKDSKVANIEVIRCHKEGLDLSTARLSAAFAAAAATSATSAVSAPASAAAWSAESAAHSASAESAAHSAWSAAESASVSVWPASVSAWSAAFDEMADEIIEILMELEP